jgi:DnaB-like helicase N terminal domain
VTERRTSAARSDSVEDHLPHNSEAERNLLGAVLMDNTHLRLAEAIVTAADFFVSPYRHIFGAMQKLNSNGQSNGATSQAPGSRNVGRRDTEDL